MIFNILDNTTEFWMTKYIIGEIFSSGRATLYKNPSDQTVKNNNTYFDGKNNKIKRGQEYVSILFFNH